MEIGKRQKDICEEREKWVSLPRDSCTLSVDSCRDDAKLQRLV